MIVSTAELLALPEFTGKTAAQLQPILDAVEAMIRKYTNNSFQNRTIRFTASSAGTVLNGSSTFLKVGDTIQISESGVNDGLYIVSAITDASTTVDRSMFGVPKNLVTKVEYPADIKQGVINLMKWEVSQRSKVGVKSETISRHSVTYTDLDQNNQVMGYPGHLLGFLEPYKKARF